MNASIKIEYDPSNFPELEPILAKAKALMEKPKGGAAALKSEIHKEISKTGSLVHEFQVKKPDGGSALREFTLGELAESAVNEVTAQSIDPNSVEDILFGRYGLIRKAGGGRSKYLMEDIEVAFIRDLIAGTQVGPIITSGRHREMSLILMLMAADIKGWREVKVRCSVIEVQNQDQVQERIISANIGSRDFSRAEIRERLGSTSGVLLSSCDSMKATIASANKADDFKAAFSCYVKMTGAKIEGSPFTATQFSDAGNSLWRQLELVRPEGGTFLSWIRKDKESRFEKVMSAVEAELQAASMKAQYDPNAGTKSSKIAKALAPLVAQRCF